MGKGGDGRRLVVLVRQQTNQELRLSMLSFCLTRIYRTAAYNYYKISFHTTYIGMLTKLF